MDSHKENANSELPETGLGGSGHEHLRGPLGPYSEISKANFTEAYGPDTIHGSAGEGDVFDFALALDSPRNPRQVHERVDREKGITVDTDIRVEHVKERR